MREQLAHIPHSVPAWFGPGKPRPDKIADFLQTLGPLFYVRPQISSLTTNDQQATSGKSD